MGPYRILSCDGKQVYLEVNGSSGHFSIDEVNPFLRAQPSPHPVATDSVSPAPPPGLLSHQDLQALDREIDRIIGRIETFFSNFY